ncbi:hypothetical protein [Emcibacter nanhaiensis]|uniref:Uncharacterized protein n=1 Tax=Emcibacter nanhaiensis TaxID=1505037 RepID=A0A501PBE7_9PROT|nr:hypothetical protein [Emcibacter nanhaiensis]TPD57693.1 hypothetical protein FIV46_16440 [Emcibacter nanhaiensis]
MSSIFASSIPPQSFIGLVKDLEMERVRIQKLKPLHNFINAGLATLLLAIAIVGINSLNDARAENARTGMAHKQINDQVVVCSLDNCRRTQTLDA